MLAASEGHTEVVSQLLEAGANTDLLSTDSEVYTNTTVYTVPVTVLAVSVRLHMSIISQYQGSALMYAANEGHTEVVTQLLKAGANTDLQTTEVYKCICVHCSKLCLEWCDVCAVWGGCSSAPALHLPPLLIFRSASRFIEEHHVHNPYSYVVDIYQTGTAASM